MNPKTFFLQEKFFSFIYFFPNYCFYFWVNHIVIYPQRKALLINSSETEVFQYRYMVNDNIVVWFPLYFLFFLIFIFTIFYFTLLYWFCHTLTWIHHGCTCVPKLEPITQSEVSQKEKHQYSILTHIYGI